MRALRPKLQEDTRTDAPALAELIDVVWSEIEGSFQSTLRGVSLANLCDRARALGISDSAEIPADIATQAAQPSSLHSIN